MPTASQIANSFVSYLKEQGVYDHLPTIVQALQDELDRNQDIIVTSAAPLEKKEQEKLEELLTKKWGEHRVIYTVDPILVSGFLVKFKDQLIDRSGHSALTDLAQELK